MKLSAAVTVIVCSVMTGLELYRRRRQVCELLSQAAGFCLYMQSCIRYEQSVPEKMMNTYPSDNALFRSCRAKLSCGCSFAEAWSIAVKENALFLPHEEFELIMHLGSELGKTDITGELMRIERIYSRLDELHSIHRGELEKDRRLYLSVSLLSGIFITLMMI